MQLPDLKPVIHSENYLVSWHTTEVLPGPLKLGPEHHPYSG